MRRDISAYSPVDVVMRKAAIESEMIVAEFIYRRFSSSQEQGQRKRGGRTVIQNMVPSLTASLHQHMMNNGEKQKLTDGTEKRGCTVGGHQCPG
jgi:hypothetical protein